MRKRKRNTSERHISEDLLVYIVRVLAPPHPPLPPAGREHNIRYRKKDIGNFIVKREKEE